jgi:hypothetical protein
MALGVDSASKRNEYQEFSWGVQGGRREADNFPAICEKLDVSQPHGPPRPVTGISLPLFFTFKVLTYLTHSRKILLVVPQIGK